MISQSQAWLLITGNNDWQKHPNVGCFLAPAIVHHKEYIASATLLTRAAPTSRPIGASGSSITVVNNCNFTVWPGISGEPVLNSSGFELTKGTSRSFQAPTNWTGYIWGRTGCRLNGSGHWSCATGDCGTGEMECYGKTYTPPATIAEINIGMNRGSYDVSIMNGFNLPMTVQLISRWSIYGKMGCVYDLNRECPPDLELEGVIVLARSVTYEYDRSDTIVYTDGDVGYNSVIFCGTFSTIKLGSQVTRTDPLISLNGNFTLGFFSADSSYLGIWYTNDVESRKVWVANPNNPMEFNPYGDHALSIDPNTGNLIITEGSTTLMTITNIDADPNPNVTATLEDNGAFTLSWEPVHETSHKILIRQRGQPYWTSENLDNQTFQSMFTLSGYTLASVYNNKERYLSYDISENSGDVIGHASFPMWILTPGGQIDSGDNDTSQWVPESCYGFQSRVGPMRDCVESSLPLCRIENEKFSNRSGYFAPHKTSNAADSNSNLSISDCFSVCWNDCTCVGFKSYNTNGTGCSFWRGSNSFSDGPRESSAWMYVIGHESPATATGIKPEFKTKLIIIIIGTVTPLIFLIRLGLLLCMKKREHQKEVEEEKRKRDEYFLELTASDSFKDVHHLESNGGKGTDLLIFSFASIVA
ncbi:G-type lectin S-receptor-like serine/threonine-protein kinase, partial [Tanacetum coccineum]